MKTKKTLISISGLLFFFLLASLRAGGQQQGPPSPGSDAKEARAGQECRIGFVNLARVLEESEEGKKMKQALEAERDKAFQDIKTEEQKLKDLEDKINALTQEILTKSQLWDDYTKLTKQNELNSLKTTYATLLDKVRIEKAKIQQDLNKENQKILKPLEDKLNAIMEDVGKKGNYCLILDISPPSSNIPNMNNILYFNTALDITDQIIKEVDKK